MTYETLQSSLILFAAESSVVSINKSSKQALIKQQILNFKMLWNIGADYEDIKIEPEKREIDATDQQATKQT